eukprot:10598064-Prorocentrum_lima.AAC.1
MSSAEIAKHTAITTSKLVCLRVSWKPMQQLQKKNQQKMKRGLNMIWVTRYNCLNRRTAQ